MTIQSGSSGWEFLGGRTDLSTPGDVVLDFRVKGVATGEVAPAGVVLRLRELGDVDGSGAVNVLDKLQMNLRLNGLDTPYPDRCFDLTGDGFVNALDKLQMNRALNGLPIP